MGEFVELRDGTSVWSTTSGSGAPVVFLNGGPGMADYLGPVADLLSPHFRIHRYEQRGCGRTKSNGLFTLATFLADIEELRTYWGYKDWWVLGHSWGVDLALAYAMQNPQSVTGLIGLAGGRIQNDREWKRVYDEKKHTEQLPLAATPPSRTVNQQLNDDWKAFCRQPELLRQLTTLNLPALFLYGEKDIRPSWPTEQISNLLPDAEFHKITNADHHLWQGNPHEMCNSINRFFASQSVT